MNHYQTFTLKQISNTTTLCPLSGGAQKKRHLDTNLTLEKDQLIETRFCSSGLRLLRLPAVKDVHSTFFPSLNIWIPKA